MTSLLSPDELDARDDELARRRDAVRQVEFNRLYRPRTEADSLEAESVITDWTARDPDRDTDIPARAILQALAGDESALDKWVREALSHAAQCAADRTDMDSPLSAAVREAMEPDQMRFEEAF